MPAGPTITPRDVMVQLQTLRTLADTLPESVATQRLALQQGIDQAQALVRQALPKPGTYVTAGGAAAIGGIAAVLGAVAGGLAGYKLKGSSKNGKAAAGELAAPATEPTAEEEARAMEAVAAEAAKRAKDARARARAERKAS
jgi:hypothetical protein